MYSRTQFARSPNNVFGFTLPEAACPRFLLPLANALFTFIFLCAPALRAQQTAANAIGRVEGNDISVEGGAGAASLGNGVPIGGAGNGQLLSFSVSNGSGRPNRYLRARQIYCARIRRRDYSGAEFRTHARSAPSDDGATHLHTHHRRHAEIGRAHVRTP